MSKLIPTEVVIAEWRRLYSHRGNPAWVFYDLIKDNLTPPPNPAKIQN